MYSGYSKKDNSKQGNFPLFDSISKGRKAKNGLLTVRLLYLDLKTVTTVVTNFSEQKFTGEANCISTEPGGEQ